MTFSSVAALGFFLIVAANGAPSASLYQSVDCSNPTNQVILHPHPTSCSHYLQCNHGTPLERPCAPGTEFSPSIGVCVHPWQSDCTAEDSVEDEEDSEEPEAPEAPEAELEEEEEVEETTPQGSLEDEEVEEGNGIKGASEAESEEAAQPSSEEVEPAEDEAASEEGEPEAISPEVTCQSRADSFFLAEYPADCTTYVICNFGQAVLRSCSDGEYFNPSISTCTVDGSHCA
ncbi:hypothetical protein HUJ04_013214 [Dendroctonus ponderosae]